MRFALKLLAGIAGLFIAYVAYWQYQYRRAETSANQFCASVTVGSEVSKTVALLQAQDGVRHGFQDNESRYIVLFKGPIFNAFTCELALADGKVVSKRVLEPVD